MLGGAGQPPPSRPVLPLLTVTPRLGSGPPTFTKPFHIHSCGITQQPRSQVQYFIARFKEVFFFSNEETECLGLVSQESDA